MKVERNESLFEPIVITIESRDEALKMWHILNTTTSDFRDNISMEGKRPSDFDLFNMWRSFNSVFDARKD